MIYQAYQFNTRQTKNDDAKSSTHIDEQRWTDLNIGISHLFIARFYYMFDSLLSTRKRIIKLKP